MATVYDWSPLTTTENNRLLTDYVNNIYSVNTIDLIASKFVGAFNDEQGVGYDLQLSASSNVKIEGVIGVSTFVGDGKHNNLYTSKLDNSNNRIDTLITTSYLSNATVAGQSVNMAIIQTGSNSGDATQLTLNGTDTYKTVFINNAKFESGSNQEILGTTLSNFRFDKPIVLNTMNVTESLFASQVTVDNDVTVGKSLFSCNINVWRDTNDTTDQHINQVGYGFQVNANNQLELIKYSRFNDQSAPGSTKSVTKRVAVFGNNNLKYTDSNDVNYLVFNELGVTSVNSDGNSSNVRSPVWQINADRTIYYSENNIGIRTDAPRYALDINGTMGASNIICDVIDSAHFVSGVTEITSDERLKDNITELSLDQCLEQIENLDVYSFNYKSDEEKLRIGFIAQQVESCIPHAVSVRDHNGITDCKVIDTTALLATVVGAVKKLQEEVAQLKQIVLV